MSDFDGTNGRVPDPDDIHGQTGTGEGARRYPGERGDELTRGVGDLADPVEVRSHSPRAGGTMLNVDEDRLFGDDGAIARVYRGHEAIRSNAWRLMYIQKLGEVRERVDAAEPEMAQELTVGEAARERAIRIADMVDLVEEEVADARTQVATAEQAIEDAIEARAAVRNAHSSLEEVDLVRREPSTADGGDEGDADDGEVTRIPTPMPGWPLERVEIALASKAKLVFSIELVVLTFVLGTLLSGVIPAHFPYAIDVYLACAGVASGMLVTGAVFGWGLAGTGLSRRAGAAVFVLAAIAVVAFGLRKLEIAYGATLPEQAQEVFVIGSFGAVLLAGFVSYVDVIYRAHERVRVAIERADNPVKAEPPHGTPLTDADERIGRMRERHAEKVVLLQSAEQRLAELEAEHDRLLVVHEESTSRVLSRQAKLNRDRVAATAMQAECDAGVRQEAGHRDANIHGAFLGWLKAVEENPPESIDGADRPTVIGPDELRDVDPDPNVLSQRARGRWPAAAATGILLLSGVVALLTHVVWVIVSGAVLAAVVLLRRRATEPKQTPLPQVADIDDVPEIADGEIAPAAGLRRWHWHPGRLVPSYERGRDPDSKHD